MRRIIENFQQTKSPKKETNATKSPVADAHNDQIPPKMSSGDEIGLKLRESVADHDAMIIMNGDESKETLYNSTKSSGQRGRQAIKAMSSFKSLPSTSSDRYARHRSGFSPQVDECKSPRHMETVNGRSASSHRGPSMDRVNLTKITTLQQNIQHVVGKIL